MGSTNTNTIHFPKTNSSLFQCYEMIGVRTQDQSCRIIRLPSKYNPLIYYSANIISWCFMVYIFLRRWQWTEVDFAKMVIFTQRSKKLSYTEKCCGFRSHYLSLYTQWNVESSGDATLLLKFKSVTLMFTNVILMRNILVIFDVPDTPLGRVPFIFNDGIFIYCNYNYTTFVQA